MLRPTGITIMAILAAVAGLYGLIGSIALIGISTTEGGVGGLVFAAGLATLAYTVLSLVLAYGFWDLRPWAWPLGIAVPPLAVLRVGLEYATERDSLAAVFITAAIAVGVLWYLFRPDVRAAFGRG